MSHSYDQKFFDWVALTAARSARSAVPIIRQLARCESVCDVGCGEGAWLAAWMENGVADVLGLDGGYVEAVRLRIPQRRFLAVDLSEPYRVARRFGVVQSLEVAEHLPPHRAESFIDELCALGDVILFSAAQPGQGGDTHVNERAVSWWAGLFHDRGYDAFDCLRPRLRGLSEIDPWYRHNAILYANAAGEVRLSDAALAARCADLRDLDQPGDLTWRLRLALLRPLPIWATSLLSRLRYRTLVALHAGGRP